MKITEILSPEMILPDLKGTTKPAILQELAGCLAARYKNIDIAALAAVLAERERLGSTAIGDGIAIPHGKVRGVAKILGVFGRCAAGVDFDSLDGGPTHLFFLLVAPEDSTSLHLKALARVSRLFKDGVFREHLIAASGADEIYRLIVEEDGRY
ncbi:MAG TPA: PTS sugar transporter subunit IIA [Candidatus Binataceae bacterium]|nr:PTS sugar transporter subunit IIA [Candidatus Binataceae bacterium]